MLPLSVKAKYSSILADSSEMVTFFGLVCYNGCVVLNKVSSVQAAISLRYRYLGNACLPVQEILNDHIQSLTTLTEPL
jgi:hypothetical protein